MHHALVYCSRTRQFNQTNTSHKLTCGPQACLPAGGTHQHGARSSSTGGRHARRRRALPAPRAPRPARGPARCGGTWAPSASTCRRRWWRRSGAAMRSGSETRWRRRSCTPRRAGASTWPARARGRRLAGELACQGAWPCCAAALVIATTLCTAPHSAWQELRAGALCGGVRRASAPSVADESRRPALRSRGMPRPRRRVCSAGCCAARPSHRRAASRFAPPHARRSAGRWCARSWRRQSRRWCCWSSPHPTAAAAAPAAAAATTAAAAAAAAATAAPRRRGCRPFWTRSTLWFRRRTSPPRCPAARRPRPPRRPRSARCARGSRRRARRPRASGASCWTPTRRLGFTRTTSWRASPSACWTRGSCWGSGATCQVRRGGCLRGAARAAQAAEPH